MSGFWSRRRRALSLWSLWLPPPRYPRLAPGDEVILDVRRHPITLVFPVLRTVVGLLVLITDAATLQLVLLFAFSVAVWARARMHAGLRRSLVLAAVPALVLLIASSGTAAFFAGTGLVLWLAEDIADWWTDRLVVSQKRIYRLHGVLTTHSPSMALPSVAFIDALQPPLGRVLGYGTILLDSVAQRDLPLSRFDHLPDLSNVHVTILKLRNAAMPRFPMTGQSDLLA